VKDSCDINIGGSQTSLSLLSRVRDRDQIAWERLVRLYSPLVYSWCLRRGLRPEDAADVGQEVFLTVAKQIGEFHHDQKGDSFRAWLFTITHNKLRNWARSRVALSIGGSDAMKMFDKVIDDADESSDVADDSRLLLRRLLELVRSEFSVEHWQAFWQVTVERKDPKEVAQALGLSTNAVYVLKSRILRRLRQELATLAES
jgi:RNA polymerase sigma-70 factor, ECF subfamily